MAYLRKLYVQFRGRVDFDLGLSSYAEFVSNRCCGRRWGDRWCGGFRARSRQQSQTRSLQRMDASSCGSLLSRTSIHHGWPQWLLGYDNVGLLGRRRSGANS